MYLCTCADLHGFVSLIFSPPHPLVALAENEPVLIKKRAEIAALRRELDAKRAALAHA
jgi:hypothetical protein